MSDNWADITAREISDRGLIQRGICLILGAADTGKTTLAAALAKHLASSRPIGIVDADVGQSHIGPPTTVGWALIKQSEVQNNTFGSGTKPQIDFSALRVGGISFVGDVTPVGHLLQLTGAVTQSVQMLRNVTDLIIIDTPGFVFGPAAAALWWTVQRIIQPKLMLAVQRADELSEVLAGLKSFDTRIEPIIAPAQIAGKSPEARRNYRQNQFEKYFRSSRLYNVDLSSVALQGGQNFRCGCLPQRIVALRDAAGLDIAVGVITRWQPQKKTVVIRAPQLDIRKTRCLVIGDVSIDITAGGD